MTKTRLDGIDLVRGITIVEMVVTHFSWTLPQAASRIVSYTETAVALFVLLAGFMVGNRVDRFQRNAFAQTKVLLGRAAKLLGLQEVLVLTAGVVMYAAGVAGPSGSEAFVVYVLRSVLLANQVGLMHILPTFLPLFVLAPIGLSAIVRGRELWLVAGSVALLVLGHFRPNVLGYGEHAIFPFVMMQAWFVIGLLWGAVSARHGLISPSQARLLLPYVLGWLVATMVIVHGKIVPAGSVHFHPLDLPGFLYHLPLVATVIIGGLAFAPRMQATRAGAVLARLGRNSLTAFVVHVYAVVALLALNALHPLPMAANIALAAASLLAMDAILRLIEARRASMAAAASGVVEAG